MKKLMLALATLLSLSTAAYADICTVALSNGYHHVRTYRGQGYGRTESCREALRQCNRDRISMPQYSYYQCQTVSHSGGGGGGGYPPNPGYESCTYRLQNNYGSTVRSFTANSYYRSQACSDASSQCHSERSYRQSRGEYGLSCVESYY